MADSPELAAIRARDARDAQTLSALKAIYEQLPDKELGEAIAMVEDRRALLRMLDALAAELAKSKNRVVTLEQLLHWLNRRGGLGLDVHLHIEAVLPSQSETSEATPK